MTVHSNKMTKQHFLKSIATKILMKKKIKNKTQFVEANSRSWIKRKQFLFWDETNIYWFTISGVSRKTFSYVTILAINPKI